MYARSYEKNGLTEGAPPLPSDYRGVAFERENETEAISAPPTEESIPVIKPTDARNSVLPSLLDRFLPIKRLLPKGGDGWLTSLFSETEDILLLGIFLLLLLSKEGDTLCAIAVLILLISDKA